MVGITRSKGICTLQFFHGLISPWRYEDPQSRSVCAPTVPQLGPIPTTPALSTRCWDKWRWIQYRWRFPKMGVLQIIHLNRNFHFKPSISGYPHLWKPLYGQPWDFVQSTTRAMKQESATQHRIGIPHIPLTNLLG